jgi:molybdate transport system ATP-binding protein
VSALALEASFSILVGAGEDRFALSAELSLDQGVLVLFGPSGAGKSLTVQALAGLIRPTRGRLAVAGEVLYDSARGLFVPPHRRRVGYVPQHHALFPHLTVAQNVAFGLPWRERRRGSPRIAALLEELGLAQLAGAQPASLSGGERQRVALARALAVEPRLLLLDEPFASIDLQGRAGLRGSLREALDRHGIPAVFVTHDPEDALALGDRMIRFERGRTTVAGTPAGLLGRAQPVLLSGAPAGPPVPLGEGRVRLDLEGASVEGPAELFWSAPDAGEAGEGGGAEQAGRLRLELRARSR